MIGKDEKWLPVKGYEDRYMVSKNGDIYSIFSKREIKLQVSKFGYYRVELNKNGQAKKFFVHRLVAIAFLENPKGKKEVNHINGIKLDNSLKNLEWVTSSENQKHAFRIGLQKKKYGENTVNAKYKEKDIIEIKRRYRTGDYTQVQLGREFGICPKHIHQIVRGKRWGYLDGIK